MSAGAGAWEIGCEVFAYLHGFNWDEYEWSKSIPSVAELETYEQLVYFEHPDLLTDGVGNVEKDYDPTA